MSSILRDSVGTYLEDLDPLLAREGMALRYRALESALAYVDDMVKEVHGGTLSEPIGQPWFDAIHYETLRWYHARYGDAMRVDADGSSCGLVLLRRVPIAVSFPLTVARPGSEPLTIRLSFPDALLDDEDAIGFVGGSIQFDGFAEAEREQIRHEVADIVRQTRRLNRDLRFAELTATTQAFVNRLMWSLCGGVESSAANSTDRLGMAVWEFNLVAELAIKILLMQRGVAFPKTHDVRRLSKVASDTGVLTVTQAALDMFPTERVAVRHRYGEEPPPPVDKLVALYKSALSFAVHCAAACERGIWIAPDGWIEMRTIGSLSRGA